MNTLVVTMPDAMAKDVAKATDILKLPSNGAFAFQAVNLLLRSVLGSRRGRPYKYDPARRTKVAKPRRRKATR